MGTGRSHDELLPIVLVAKIVAGGICVAFPRARRFGIGLLLSIPVGFLIFAVSAFVHIVAR